MQKAFTLLELIIVVLLISIVVSFAISKYDTIFYNSNLSKLKSDVSLIQNGISKIKRKNILLANSLSLISLDEANNFTKDEKLFSKVIDFSIVSTNTNKSGMWLKANFNDYIFFLTKEQKIEFSYENEEFKCTKPKEVCLELQ